MSSKYIIHTVGPIVEEKQQLANCYLNSLISANEYNLSSIAFPCISTGVFHFPNELAAQITVRTIKDYLNKNFQTSI